MNDVKEYIPEAESAPGQHSAAKKVTRIALRPAIVIFMTMLAVIICLSASVIILALKFGNVPETASAENTEVSYETSEDTFVPVVNNRVYDFYDKDDVIIFNDPVYGQVWVPAFDDVPKHTYDYSGLALENGRYTYSENGKVISRTGIDVSYHQGDIDWDLVAADGIDFAMLRVGYRGYESGYINADENFHSYIQGALDAGLDVGVYFFSQALNSGEAIEEANFVLEQIQGYDISMPVVFDWEVLEDETARTHTAAPHTVTECAAAFCDTVADRGYTPMFYGNKKFAIMKMDVSKLNGIDFWYAEYKNGHNAPEYPYDFRMWQYASDGRVNGINGDVDMDICFYGYGTSEDPVNDD